MQTAMLSTVEFYELAKSRLSPQGIVSLCLCGTSPEKGISRAITASILRVFPYEMALSSNSAASSFAYASKSQLPFDSATLAIELAKSDRRGGEFYDRKALLKMVSGTKPIELANLLPVLTMAREALPVTFPFK
jgi:spermidine synthase